MSRSAPPPATRPQSGASPSWRDCLDAGMTAREAAEARGRSRISAYAWARNHGVRWADGYHRADRDRIRQLAAEGHSQSTAAAIIGVSRERVRQIANKYGIPFESGRCDLYGLERVRRLHGVGLTDAEIAEHMGLSVRAVGKKRQSLGLPPNRKPSSVAMMLCAYRDAGLTRTEVARLLGHKNAGGVFTTAKRHGIDGWVVKGPGGKVVQ